MPSSVAEVTTGCVPATSLPAAPRRVRYRRPPNAEIENIQTSGGTLLYEITIGTSGKVTEVRRLNRKRAASPSLRLADLWQKALQQWEFEPTVVAGARVAVCMTVAVTIDI